MNLQEMLQELDTLLKECRLEEAGVFLQEKIEESKAQNQMNIYITLLNEKIGYERDCGFLEASLETCSELEDVLQIQGLVGTQAYGTSLLNIANAYRAAGRLQDAEACFAKVKQCYDQYLPERDLLYASYYNNLSLLYQEQGRFEEAVAVQYRALSVVQGKDLIKTGISRVNLGVSLLRLDRVSEAVEELGQALEILGGHVPSDFHYSAALSGMGDACMLQGDAKRATEYYEKALSEIHLHMGENPFYYTVSENLLRAYEADLDACPAEAVSPEERLAFYRRQTLLQDGEKGLGLALAKRYYESFGAEMLRKNFKKYVSRIAVGLCGEGSECLGYDDAYSADHDFGPGFCLWLEEEDAAKIGEALQRAYDLLPKRFMGYERKEQKTARGRVGVATIKDYFRRLLGTSALPSEDNGWYYAEDSALATAVSGTVFTDALGVFTKERKCIEQGYPTHIWLRRLAQCLGRLAQTGQYNCKRMRQRGDVVTSQLYLAEFAKGAMELAHLLERRYAPYEKWLWRSTKELEQHHWLASELQKLFCGDAEEASREGVTNHPEEALEGICEKLREVLIHAMQELPFWERQAFLAGDLTKETYLEPYAWRLAEIGEKMEEKDLLVRQIVLLEWAAFDQVDNEGGRANCQDDWDTFSIMRTSQYEAWTIPLLSSYLQDLEAAASRGWNLITEKYGRMMESTAPTQYQELSQHFPKLSEKRMALQEAIIQIQVGWMEALAQQYPRFAGNARSIHTWEDTVFSTSYETYLRGEISTYSERTIQLYGTFVAELAQRGENLAQCIMSNTARAYGYRSIAEAEAALLEKKE